MPESPTLRRRQLGRELRQARERLGLSREQLASKLGSNVSTVSRVEAGVTGTSRGDLALWMAILGIDDPIECSRLEKLRAEGRKRGWWSAHHSALRPSYSTFIGLEDAADSRRDYSCLLIPSPLQTRGYAEAVMDTALPRLSADDIRRRVDIRIQRQEIVRRSDNPLELHVVLDEACIRRKVGGQQVWRTQLEHLLSMSYYRNITVQVLPFAAGALAEGLPAFVVLGFDNGPDIAHVELPTGDLYSEGEEAEKFVAHFDALRTVALAPAMSTAMIEELLHT